MYMFLSFNNQSIVSPTYINGSKKKCLLHTICCHYPISEIWFLFMKAGMYQTILKFTVTMSLIFSQPMLKYTRDQVHLQAYTE